MRRIVVTASVIVMLLILSGLTVTSQPAQAQDAGLAGYNIYFSEANTEASRFDRDAAGISRYAGLLAREGANLFTLEWRKGIPDDANLIVIINPTTDLSSEQVARLWAYLRRGGRVLIVADPIDFRENASRALPASRGFFELAWNDMGLRTRDDVIVQQGEFREIEVIETDREGNVTEEYTANVPELFAQFTTSSFDATHPITQGLTGDLYYDISRSVEFDATIQDFEVTPLIMDGNPDSYGKSAYSEYMRIGVSEYNIGEDTGLGSLALAAAYEDPNTNARMVLLGDLDILRNGTGFETSPPYSPNFLNPTNVDFMLNVTTWLLDVPAVSMDFPAPEATFTPTITPTVTPIPEPTAEASGS